MTTKRKFTRVALEGIKYFAYHGYYDEEQVMGNEYMLDISLDIPLFDGKDGDIEKTVNYEEIYKICENRMEMKYRLLEALVRDIAKDLSDTFSSLENGTVRIAKIGVQLGGVIDQAVVEHHF